MKVEKKDCIGQIADFPVDIVQAMVNNQVEQDNQALVSIFQVRRDMHRTGGGFDWSLTPEGITVWNQVLNYKNFKAFYDFQKAHAPIIDFSNEAEVAIAEEFAKEVIEEAIVPSNKLGDDIMVIDASGKAVKRIFIAYCNASPKPILAVTAKTWKALLEGFETPNVIAYEQYAPVPVKEEIVFLTYEEISEGKGVGIPPHLLKIKKSKR